PLGDLPEAGQPGPGRRVLDGRGPERRQVPQHQPVRAVEGQCFPAASGAPPASPSPSTAPPSLAARSSLLSPGAAAPLRHTPRPSGRGGSPPSQASVVVNAAGPALPQIPRGGTWTVGT